MEKKCRCPCPAFLAGPTAAGKSAVALELAEHINGEIISVDSMQVYRGLDIGTAKPSPVEQNEFPTISLMSLGWMNRSTPPVLFRWPAPPSKAIQSRGRTPVFCGGTDFTSRRMSKGWAIARLRSKNPRPNWNQPRWKHC